MPIVFLSYSKKDHLFAELAELKLAESGIQLWRDQGQLRAGSDWRQGIEAGINDSLAVVVALSPNSSESTYVTFEWSFALGRNKVVVPVKLGECFIHPRLATIQYLDFSVPGALPWESLAAEILDIEVDTTTATTSATLLATIPKPEDANAKAILAYLNQRGYQMASFDRLRRRIDSALTDEAFNDIIVRNPGVFAHATLAEGKPGIKKVA